MSDFYNEPREMSKAQVALLFFLVWLIIVSSLVWMKGPAEIKNHPCDITASKEDK